MTAEPVLPADEMDDPPEASRAPGEMTILEHLIELRNRVLVSAIALVIGVMVCFLFWENILEFLLEPARAEMGPDFTLASFSPTDRIVALFKIGLYGGVILASPVLIYELLAFIVPGLTGKEKRILFFGAGGAILFMLAGMAFAYYIILPQSLGFLLNLADDNVRDVIGIQQYTDFVTRIVFWVGLAFELPMVLALAAAMGLVTARQLLSFWRYAIIIVFIMAAIVTPTPDPLTQTLVAGPLFILYFLGILFAWILYRPRFGNAPSSSTDE